MLYDPFASLDRGLTRLSTRPATTTRAWRPPLDVHRDGDRYVVEMELPGVDPSAIDITLQDGWLSVKADRSTSRERHDDGWVVRERDHTAVVRRLAVDEAVDADAVSADYVDGVLTVTLPLTEQARPRRIPLTGTRTTRELGTAARSHGTTAHQAAARRTAVRGKAEAAHSVAS